MSTLSAICPRCRRVTRPGKCEIDDTATLEPSIPAQRDRMVEITWGMADRREELRRSLTMHAGPRRTLVGGTLAAIAMAVSYVGTENAVLSLIAGGLGGLLGVASAVARPVILIPSSATPMPASWPRVGVGKIVRCEESLAPGSDTPCAAWAIELRYAGSWGTRTVFRAGVTNGIDIIMDGGDHVRIPAGPLWLDGPFAQLDGERSFAELLEDIDPGAVGSDWELFPFNIIMEQLVDEGDRVEVLGVVEPRPARTDDLKLYRDMPVIELVHPGLPVLRRA